MLQKVIKTALIAAMVFGTSSMAFADDEAEVKVNARTAQYYGQLDTGVEGEKPRFKLSGETGLRVTGTKGRASVFMEIESRPGRDGETAFYGGSGEDVTPDTKLIHKENNEFKDVIIKASLKSPIGLITLGTIQSPIAQTPVTAGAGIKCSDGGYGNQLGGTMAGSSESAGLNLLLPLSPDLIFEFTMWDKAPAKLRTLCGAGLCQTDDGSAMALGANVKLGSINVRGGYTSETIGGQTDATTDLQMTSTYMHFGGAMDIGSMNIGLSYVSNTVPMEIPSAMSAMNLFMTANGLDTEKFEHKMNVISLSFSMKDLGPGTLNFGYESLTWKFSHHDLITPEGIQKSADATCTAKSIPVGAICDANVKPSIATSMATPSLAIDKTGARMHVIYDIPVVKGAGFQIIYDTSTMTPTIGTAVTKTFMGGGIYGYF